MVPSLSIGSHHVSTLWQEEHQSKELREELYGMLRRESWWYFQEKMVCCFCCLQN